MPRRCRLSSPVLAIAGAIVCSSIACCSIEAAAASDDPIGPLQKISRYDNAAKIEVGRSASGMLTCYVREQGSSHQLDIGVSGTRAFIRLEAPDEREATPQRPLKVFAGKSISADTYAPLKSFDGAVTFVAPRQDRADFTLIAEHNPREFLQMVAAARGEFVVVQSAADAKISNIVAIYHFSAKAIAPLLACAAERTSNAAAAQAAAPIPTTTASDWTTYNNARFGTLVDYPADLFSERDPAPTNNDGRTFRSRDGRARLSVYGAHNVEADTPQAYFDKYVDAVPLSFRRVTGQFYALSGRRGEEIYYQRCNFVGRDDGSIHCVEISYPQAEKAVFDPIVERISRSLRQQRPAD
jgi:hypothetical protein